MVDIDKELNDMNSQINALQYKLDKLKQDRDDYIEQKRQHKIFDNSITLKEYRKHKDIILSLFKHDSNCCGDGNIKNNCTKCTLISILNDDCGYYDNIELNFDCYFWNI